MSDLTAIISEIESGLPHERDRLDTAKASIDHYRGQFAAYLHQWKDGQYKAPRHIRTSLIMQRVINVLCQHLYAKGPAREIEDNPTATDWLQEQYHREGIDGLLQEAQRLSIAADVAAVQVVGSGDLLKPVRFQVWPADQFMVWESPEDPTKPIAVATLDYFDESRRLRLWTADEVTTFRTDKLLPGQTVGGTAFNFDSQEENTYGCIPFAYIHAIQPTTQFWSPGPGDCLRLMNEYINNDLTELGDSLRFARKPIIKSFGTESQPPIPLEPGTIWRMAPSAFDEAANGVVPEVDYLQPDMSFVDASWADLQSYIDHVLETLGVPTAAFRMVESSTRSGVAIVAEQLPLILWAQGQQRPFGVYEKDLARVTFQVGAAELARLGGSVPGGIAPQLADTLSLRWPSMVPDVPLYGQAQEQADAADLSLGMISRIQVTMRKFNLSRDQAVAHLQQVAVDLAEETTIGLPPIPTAPTIQEDSSNADSGAD